ncbi:hypothetical protein AGABI1DRAFT_111677 [Agaricus bisporus var. burnettii JB137-S8]|uniref:Uncharacterized protein n=1 Tax=Agaricus bisporus var. burnettii (strain JB137-S8 / ATCC MYA-4627 / FGSC 10392) TaxID=597362 RepID=K5XIS7_AGABU|nr:uncharacterized protein AGABI1DRAFT_111677 [Agaricus bisporus var. burnettii JB137-S8]EKM83222.1 hypothetical protein AGABI1DRAFT_111677 [Agaricus bisporus var. burnettii JB137-S8]
MKMLSVIRDSGPEIEPEVFLRQILSCLRPMFCGWEVHPKVVKTALHSLVHRNLYSAATELANAYFSILPAGIDEETNAECMEMVHLLMSVDTKRGIPSFYANQKLLVALLRTHSSLQPSPDTFLLLLSSLRRAKKSSTVAFEVMASFRHRWGDRVFDDRVKQHILNLAEKEGRLDIAEKIRNQWDVNLGRFPVFEGTNTSLSLSYCEPCCGVVSCWLCVDVILIVPQLLRRRTFIRSVETLRTKFVSSNN